MWSGRGVSLWRSGRPGLRRREFLPSAVNPAHYIALRRRDLRGMQEALMPLGLSSLGRCEARVLGNLDAVIASLARILGGDSEPRPIRYPRPRVYYRGDRLLPDHTEAVLGPVSGAGRCGSW